MLGRCRLNYFSQFTTKMLALILAPCFVAFVVNRENGEDNMQTPQIAAIAGMTPLGMKPDAAPPAALPVVHVPAGEIYDALKRVKHAISTEETRYHLGGAFLHQVDGKGPIKLCATDGHRMAVVELASANVDKPFPGTIISAASVADILKSGIAKRSRQTYDCPIEVSPSLIRLHPYDNPIVECTPIDGTFPDYLRVIPRGETKRATIDHVALVKAVAAVYGFIQGASGKSHVAVKFDFVGSELKVSGEAETVGKAWYTIPLREEIESPLQIGFNGRYVLDILASLEGNTATFKLSDAGSPTIIEGDTRDSHALHVLMPIRV